MTETRTPPTRATIRTASMAAALLAGGSLAGEAHARGKIPVLVQVTHNTTGNVVDPRIRLEGGDKITFASNGDVLGPGTSPGHHEVYLYRVDTEQMERVTNTPPGVVVADQGSWDAARSTDQQFAGGRPEFVALVSRGDFDPSVGNADANPEIFLWEVETGVFHQLTDTQPPVVNKEPFPSDNGKCIVFSSNGDLDNNDGSDFNNPGTGNSNEDGSFEVFLYSLETAQNFPDGGNFTQVSDGPIGTNSTRPVINGYWFARQCQTTAYVSDYDQVGGSLSGSNIFVFDRNSATTDVMSAPKEIPWGIQPGNYLFPMISAASQFARGPFVVFQTNADLWRNGSSGFEMFRYRVFHPRMTQYTDQAVGSVERPVVSDGGSLIAFQSNGEILNPEKKAKKGGTPPFNADGNYEIFRLKGRTKAWQLTRTTGCQNVQPSIRDDGTALVFRSTCDLVPGGNPSAIPQVFLYKEVKPDDPLATAAGCKISEGCCNEANGCYAPIQGRKAKARKRDCLARPRDGCNAPPS